MHVFCTVLCVYVVYYYCYYYIMFCAVRFRAIAVHMDLKPYKGDINVSISVSCNSIFLLDSYSEVSLNSF